MIKTTVRHFFKYLKVDKHDITRNFEWHGSEVNTSDYLTEW